MEIKLENLYKCPVFDSMWKEIMSKDWNTICKEIEKIVAPLDELVGAAIEYNTDTSIPHSNKSEDIVRPAHITNESVEIKG